MGENLTNKYAAELKNKTVLDARNKTMGTEFVVGRGWATSNYMKPVSTKEAAPKGICQTDSLTRPTDIDHFGSENTPGQAFTRTLSTDPRGLFDTALYENTAKNLCGCRNSHCREDIRPLHRVALANQKCAVHVLILH